jgi:hypothetical protein
MLKQWNRVLSRQPSDILERCNVNPGASLAFEPADFLDKIIEGLTMKDVSAMGMSTPLVRSMRAKV